MASTDDDVEGFSDDGYNEFEECSSKRDETNIFDEAPISRVIGIFESEYDNELALDMLPFDESNDDWDVVLDDDDHVD